MTNNVVSFRRRKDGIKDEVIAAIEQNDNSYQFYITFPESEEGKIFFYSNFTPGMRELMALESVLEYMRDQAFPVEEYE
jgi:anion-transporting  ArsA/GET3 family ATPase